MNQGNKPPIICGQLTKKSKFVIVVLEDNLVGVSASQFTSFPTSSVVTSIIKTDIWVNAKRDQHDSVSIVYPHHYEDNIDLVDATEIAIETALWLWPDWSPDIRAKVKPQSPIFSSGGHNL
jgi:hypothetical protein